VRIHDLAERTDVAFGKLHDRLIIYRIPEAFIAAARIGHMATEEIDEDEHGHRGATGRPRLA